MPNAVRFKQKQVPKQSGERARLKVVGGPDLGCVYVVTGTPIGIGRGEGCDVMLTDLKTSRLHCDISWMPHQGWIARDLGSANGIKHNGNDSKLAILANGDTVALGETVLEFVGVEVGTQVLVSPPKELRDVQVNQQALQVQQDKVQAIASFGGLAKFATAQPGVQGASQAGAQSNTKRLVMYGAVAVILGIVFLLPDDQKAKLMSGKSKKQNDDRTARDLASYMPPPADSEVGKTVETLFRSGFREYREHNYLRAKTQFETVLQVDPTHRLARLYLANSDKAIEEEVKEHLSEGRKDFSAGKLTQSRSHYEAILRLLYKDQSNAAFVEAKEQLDKVNQVIKGEGTS